MSWIEIIALSLLPLFLLLDVVHRAYPSPATTGWRLRAFFVTAVNFILSMAIGLFWARIANGSTVFDGTGLGMVGGALVGVLVYELCHYGYHRFAHRSPVLWRLGHQMHHSAESLDAWGAYYLHPLDAAIFLTMSSLVLFPLLGLSPAAGGMASAILTFLAIFQHANVRTPHWLGWFIQRPEAHAVHHARGVHAYNYSDLPLWDMVFGTYRNPRDGERPEQGFYPGASARIGAMLAFRDVSEPSR